MEKISSNKKYVVCIKNEGFAASLELRKIYEAVSDRKETEHKMIRVIDESGEEYLYPSEFFIELRLPKPVEDALSIAV